MLLDGRQHIVTLFTIKVLNLFEVFLESLVIPGFEKFVYQHLRYNKILETIENVSKNT